MPQPEIAPWDYLHDTHLQRLAPGSRVLHIMAFDGVYPPEWEAFQETRAHGVTIGEPNNFNRQVDALASQDIAVGRLRLLPNPGDRYTNGDIQLMRDTAHRAGILGREIVRFVQLSEIIDNLRAHCGSDSPILGRFEDGIRTRQPQAGIWSVRPAEELTLGPTVIRLMGYQNNELSEDRVYEQPIPLDLERYEQFWYNLFFRSNIPDAY